MSNDIIRTELIKEINSLSVDKDGLKRILQTLQTKATEACDLECDFIDSMNESQENLALAKDNAKKCSQIKVTIKGYNGEDLFGSIEEVFNPNIFPDKVKTVYVNSEAAYVSWYNHYPRNSFHLFIDFSKPRVFDFSIQPSDKTPNGSNFKVIGYNSTWVNGVFSELDRIFLNRKIKFIHKVSTYDLLVWLVGIPFGFWACFRLSPIIYKSFGTNSFLANAFFVYIFIASLFAMRILFHYSRWVYPMVEFKNKNDRAFLHRAALYTITIGMFGKFLYDMFRWIFNL